MNCKIGMKSPQAQTGVQVRYGNTEDSLKRTLREKDNSPSDRTIVLTARKNVYASVQVWVGI